MAKNYEAILRGDQIEWVDGRPHEAELNVRFKVSITVIEPVHSGEAMAEIFNRLAAMNAFSYIDDPVAWQREQREDRSLPGRE